MTYLNIPQSKVIGGDSIKSPLIIKRKHPFKELSDLLNNAEDRVDPFQDPKYLLILPDKISINNAKGYVSKKKPDVNNQITYTTFEALAKMIIQHQYKYNPTVLENHYLRYFVYQYITETNGTDGSDLSKKVFNIIGKTENPERTPLIKDMVREFLDYLMTIYPPSLEDPSKGTFHDKLLQVAKESDIHKYEKKKSVNILEYYRDMEYYMRENMNEHFDNNYFLSRAHLVGEATEIIKKDPTVLDQVFGDINSVRILAVSFFDATVFELVKVLNDHYEEFMLVSGKGTHDRIKKRCVNIFDEGRVKIEEEEDIKHDHIEKWELPNPRMEVEFVGSLMDCEEDIENSIVIARESGIYLPYAKEVLRDFGLPSHVQTRRYLSLSVPFRLVASLLDLLKKDEWTVEDISNPLRLGFSFYHTQGEESFVGVLSDHQFLKAEYWLNNYLRRGENSLTPVEWDRRTKYDTNYYVRKLMDWKNSVDHDNVGSKLKREIGKFQKYACHVSRQREARNGLTEKEYNRAMITKTHITGDAQRVIGLIERADEFSRFIAKMEGHDRKIIHMIKAFWIVGGRDTYGKPRRDLHAVKFVDAANSFFLPQKNRIILGMRSDTFPRKPPEGKFLPTSFREKVNEGYSQLYLQDPRTDYENEEDYFEAAMGPGSNGKVYQLNPYLDDRGHKNNWSVFSTHGEPFHIRPADFYLENPTKHGRVERSRNLLTSKPKSRFQKAVDTYRRNGRVQKKDLADHFEGLEKNMIDSCVVPHISKYEDRIATDHPRIIPPDPREEKYLAELIDDQNTQPVPAHEIDLWMDCPIKYYFYRFVFSQSYWKKDLKEFEKGSRLYIPEYWDDFDFGSVPRVLMRAYFSSIGHEFISTFIEPSVSGKSIDVQEQLDRYFGYYETKENLQKFYEMVVEKREEVSLGQKGVWQHEKSENFEFIRPPLLKFKDSSAAPGGVDLTHITLARHNFDSTTVQNSGYGFGNWVPKEDIYNTSSLYYILKNKIRQDGIKSLPLLNIFFKHDLFKRVDAGAWETVVLEELIEEIQNLRLIKGDRRIKLEYRKRKCEDCIYRRLCGDWEVLD